MVKLLTERWKKQRMLSSSTHTNENLYFRQVWRQHLLYSSFDYLLYFRSSLCILHDDFQSHRTSLFFIEKRDRFTIAPLYERYAWQTRKECFHFTSLPIVLFPSNKISLHWGINSFLMPGKLLKTPLPSCKQTVLDSFHDSQGCVVTKLVV